VEPTATFWNRLLEVGEYVGADLWFAVAAAVALSLTTGIIVLCMWARLRETQLQVMDLSSKQGSHESQRSEDDDARLGGLALDARLAGEGLDSRITAAEALAKRLDSLQLELVRQLAHRRDIAARLDTQLRQQCIQLTTGLLQTEGLRLDPMAEIGDLAAQVDSINHLFESVELSSPGKII
jgi:hypothetical protein